MSTSDTKALRERAEEMVRKFESDHHAEPYSQDLATLLHELSVHQAELEMQGEELRRTADELEKSREIYWQNFLAAPLPIIRTNPEGKIIEANESARQALRLPADRAAAGPLNLLHNKCLRPANQDMLTLLRQAGSSREHLKKEVWFVTEEEKKICYDILAKPILGQHNSITGEILLYFQEVTQRAENQIVSDSKTQLLEAILETEFTGYWDWDLLHDEIHFSQSSCRILGYEKDELSSDPSILEELIHPKDLHQVEAEMKKCWFSGQAQPYQQELRFRHKKNHWVWVICLGRVIEQKPDGSPTRIVGCHVDYSRAHKAEASSSLLLEAIRHSPSALMVTDAQGDIEYVNPAFEQMTQYSMEEVSGKNPRFLQSGKTPLEMYAMLWDQILRGNIWKGTIQNRRKDGESYWESASIAPIKDEDGEITHFVAIKEDISLQRQAEEALLASNRALATAQEEARVQAEKALAATKAKSQFLANMSHEIRTPMNGVIGMAEILSQSDLSEEQNQQLQILQSSAHSLLTLINDILDFSKIEADKLTLNPTCFSPNQLVRQVVETFALQAEQKGLKLHLDTSSSAVDLLRGDASRIRQILVNLVGNAIKFTKFGFIEVEVSSKLNDDTQEALLEISVRDTGPGIAAIDQKSLFDVFVQVDSAHNRSYEGSGLGLSISQKLAQLMGGRIGLKSPLDPVEEGSMHGPGALFTLELTLPRAHEAQDKVSPEKNTSSDQPDKLFPSIPILVVEDNETNQLVMDHFLSKLGISPDHAQDGYEALAALKNKDYALIFMDIQMPGIDGLETTRRIRALAPRTPESQNPRDLPIIALTAHAMAGDREIFLRAGLNDYLAKPVRLKDLKEMLLAWLPH